MNRLVSVIYFFSGFWLYICKTHCFTHKSGKEFNEDLTPRKSSIKLMIQSELTKLAEEAGEEEEEEEKKEEDAEKEKKKEKAEGGSGAGEEVKA